MVYTRHNALASSGNLCRSVCISRRTTDWCSWRDAGAVSPGLRRVQSALQRQYCITCRWVAGNDSIVQTVRKWTPDW